MSVDFNSIERGEIDLDTAEDTQPDWLQKLGTTTYAIARFVIAGVCWLLGMILVIGSVLTTWIYVFPMLDKAGILDPMFWFGTVIFVFWCGWKLLAAAKLLSGQNE